MTAESIPDRVAPARKKRLLILLTDYSYFESHKTGLARAAADAGFEVFVAARGAKTFTPSDGFKTVDVGWRRTGSLLAAVAHFLPDTFRIRRLVGRIQPDILHNVALKPAIFGSIAALGRDVAVVNSINGFGFVFHSRSVLARLAQFFCGAVLRLSTRANAGRVVLQNRDDLGYARDHLGVAAGALRLIRGSGVEPGYFTPQSAPALAPFRFLLLSRLLKMKGIDVAVEAHQLLRARGVGAELVVAGGPDPANPSSISAATIARWSALPGVRFLGHVGDVRPALADCHVVVHAALGGEGLPKALLEAAACGRAMIASDIPGNREVAVPGETGLLVPAGDAEALSAAMQRVAGDWAECRRWGDAARAKVVREFASDHIAEQHSRLYREFVTVKL